MSARDCINRIRAAAGRDLTDEEVAKVFERIHTAALSIKSGKTKLSNESSQQMLSLEPQAQTQSALLIQEAAQEAAADMKAEADLTEKRAELQILKLQARGNDYNTVKENDVAPLDAAKFTIARDYSGKSKIASLEQMVMGKQSYYGAKLLKTWEALGNDFFGFFQDKAKLLDLIKELRGEDSGNKIAREGAKRYHEAAEEARQEFNDNGGSIGKLDDWGMPQHHGQERVAAAGGFAKDPVKAKEFWINKIMPMLDRARYVDGGGVPWSDAEVKEFLGHAWDTIATDGIANLEPGKSQGNGSRANRHAEERQIHFKDAQSYIDYWTEFGDQSAMQILLGHMDTMARDIAFVEWGGPNPNTTYQTLRDTALKDAVMAMPTKTESLQGQAAKLDNLYNYASGRVIPTANMTLRKTADAIAHLNVAGKLGGSMLASLFGDKPIMEAVSHLNDLPALQRWRTELALLNPANSADRALLQQQGLMLENVRSGLQRFYEGMGDSSTTGKLANAVMRVTGMQAINDIRKGSFGLSLMNAIGSQIKAKVDFASLSDSDIRTLRNYGIEPRDWQIWQMAKLEDYGHGNTSMLTPEAIGRIPDANLAPLMQGTGFTAPELRRQAIVKLLGAVNTESDFAIVTPGWNERAQFYADLQRGTLKGEIARSMLQFKAFPWAQFQRGMDAVSNAEGPAGKAVMASYIIVSTTLAGAMLMQTREMLAGKDPRKMNDRDWYKFWGAAFIYGGAMGIYGDFLYSPSQTRYGSGPLEVMAGPTMGPALSMLLVQPGKAINDRMNGKETHLAAQTMAQAKGFLPGNNIWYTKAAIDHLIWQRVMEMSSPGYLSKIRSGTQRDFGQEWYWQPGETFPERPPNLKAAVK